MLQLCDDDFRAVIESNRDNAVSDSPADDHGSVIFIEQACIIFREEALIGCHQAANDRQTELATMGMATEYQIDSGIRIDIKQFRPVSQQDRIAVRLILQFSQRRCGY